MGSAVSASIRQQAKALKGRRYMNGMLPEKYFEVVVKKEHGELLDILGFTEEEAFEIFVQVSVDEFHGHLDSQATKFSERVFSILDQDLSGMLDLREFVIGVWNYCTYDTTLVAKLLFDIFDVDKRGKLTMAELDAMIRMLHGSPDADPELLRLLAVNGSADEDALTFEEFLQVVKDNYAVAQPAFELQKAIRRKGDLTSVQAVEAIVSAKKLERMRELEKKKMELAAAHDRDLQQAAQEHRALHEDLQLRKKYKLNELRDARPADEVEEESAWVAFKEAQSVVRADFTESTVDDLRNAREVLWNSFDRAIASSKARARLKAARELELASNDDANGKADAWILTKQGRIKYDFLCRQSYGNLLHKAYVERGPPMQAFAALHAPDDSPVTLATRIAYDHPRPAIQKEAKTLARAAVVARFAKQEAAEARSRAAKEAAQQEMDFSVLHQQLVAEVGARGTSWDRLWDPEEEDEYYLHRRAKGHEDGPQSTERYPKNIAICHDCDEIIAPEDRTCGQCQAARSAKNEELYVGFKV